MARIRSIKPDFWTDEKVVELSPWERLLFIGVWNFCDDQGYIDDKPRRIKMQVFPGDDMSVAEIEKMLHNLVAAGVLSEHDSPVGPVLHVRNWERHQRVDRPSTPRFDTESLRPRRMLDEASGTPSGTSATVPDSSTTPMAAGTRSVRTEFGMEQGVSGITAGFSTSPQRVIDEGSLPSLDAEGKGREGKGRDKELSSAPRPKRARTTDDPNFDRFWDAYPRKESKGAARKAWKTALTKTTVENLIAAAEAYRFRTRNDEPRFVAHASTWLNAERWEDQPARPRAVGNANGGAFWDA